MEALPDLLSIDAGVFRGDLALPPVFMAKADVVVAGLWDRGEVVKTKRSWFFDYATFHCLIMIWKLARFSDQSHFRAPRDLNVARSGFVMIWRFLKILKDSLEKIEFCLEFCKFFDWWQGLREEDAARQETEESWGGGGVLRGPLHQPELLR